VSKQPWAAGRAIVLDAEKFRALPEEAALRLLGRAIAHAGDEGPVELGKLEALFEALRQAVIGGASPRLRRTLAGALVTLSKERVVIERAPPRAFKNASRSTTLTKRQQGGRAGVKRR
jgi:tRNA(Ile)-lysidine synthase